MSQKVIYNLDWRSGKLDDSSVHDLHADYTYVPDSNDLAHKADLTYVNNKLSAIEKSTQSSISNIRQQTEASIASLQQYVQEALASKDRIESEKRELTILFQTLTSNLKEECLIIEKQLGAEIKTYQEIDQALNEKLRLLLSHKDEFVDAKNNADAIIQELTKQIALAGKAMNKFKKDPYMELQGKIKDLSYGFYIMLANIFILNFFLLRWLFF